MNYEQKKVFQGIGLKYDFYCILKIQVGTGARAEKIHMTFAYVIDHMHPKLNINMFEVEVFQQVSMEFRLRKEPQRWQNCPQELWHHRTQSTWVQYNQAFPPRQQQ